MALNRMSQFFALELNQHNVAVNALCPGSVITHSWRGVPKEMLQEMLDAGRGKLPTPEVMGPALLYLARQDASGVTGQVLGTDEFGVSWPWRQPLPVAGHADFAAAEPGKVDTDGPHAKEARTDLSGKNGF